MYMLILNFTYPLRCLRVPPVEYHWIRQHVFHHKHYRRRRNYPGNAWSW